MDDDDKAVILMALAEALGWPYKIIATETTVRVEWL